MSTPAARSASSCPLRGSVSPAAMSCPRPRLLRSASACRTRSAAIRSRSRDRQQPVGDTGRYEPRHAHAIVAAELQRALDEPNPLRGIAQLVARIGDAFVIDEEESTVRLEEHRGDSDLAELDLGDEVASAA